ncbi:MAG TPA: cysteine--tRNA ligase [Vicinamibacteria bacterium]
MNLYNTLTGRVEALAPAQPPELRMYVCGPTVYGRAHIGNFRSFVATDLLRRVLRYKGWRVKEVMNVTDVDDKIIHLASKAGEDLPTFTTGHIRSFEEDRAALRLETPEFRPRATDHIPDMIDLVQRLIARGHTYATDGSVYFKISTFPRYGRLSRLDVTGIKSGARVDTDKYDKENARDFVLWKAKADEPGWAQWDAPFGRGRPGWHLECSAMSMRYLGETFDLHCGGVDLIFPHHENEIAQSECATGQPFVSHWMHVAHLLVDNETMSKSKGNFYTIPDLVERGHRPDAVRYVLSAAHYRKPLNFTWDALHQAATSIDKVHGFVRRLDEVERDGPAPPPVEEAVGKAREAFDRALDEDLNTPEALAAVHELVNDGNRLLADGGLTREGAQALRAQIESMDSVFAVLMPGEDRLSAEEQALFDARQEARRKREFQKADEHRKKLEEMGVILEDTPKGTRWRRKH